MAVIYQHHTLDNVPLKSQVSPVGDNDYGSEMETVEGAIQIYLRAYEVKFTSRLTLMRRTQEFERFVRFLKKKQHTLLLQNLTSEDGQEYLIHCSISVMGQI